MYHAYASAGKVLKYGMHRTPLTGRDCIDRRFPALFAVEERRVPPGIPLIEAIAYLPMGPHLLFFVVGSIDAEPEREQLRIIRLKAILHIVRIQFMIDERHLQIEAVRIVHYLRITVLLIRTMDEHKHAQHLKLAVGFAREGVMLKRGQREKVTYLCSELL